MTRVIRIVLTLAGITMLACVFVDLLKPQIKKAVIVVAVAEAAAAFWVAEYERRKE